MSVIKAYILDQNEWDEVRRKEGKDAGEPYIVPSKNRLISIRFPEIYKDQEVIVLVRKPKETMMEDT